MKRFFGLFTLKGVLGIIGLGVGAAVIANENFKHGRDIGYQEGVHDSFDIKNNIIEELKEEDAAK